MAEMPELGGTKEGDWHYAGCQPNIRVSAIPCIKGSDGGSSFMYMLSY